MLRLASEVSAARCEPLEARRLLTGSWSALASLAPNQVNNDGVSLMLLLPDGSVMAHAGAGNIFDAGRPGNVWYKLTPLNGNYVNGTWSTLPAMKLRRQFFASHVMRDGRVLVLGGEYSDDPNLFPMFGTNGSDTPTGEIFDPLAPPATAWTDITPFPDPNPTPLVPGLGDFGDASTAVLPDGRILATGHWDPHTYIYNPASNAWTQTADKLRNDPSDEETWIKLPDDSILSYDITASINLGVGHAQRYVPGTDTWVDTGNLPFLLSNNIAGQNPKELGPGFLLPDGRVWLSGANGRTAYYTPATDSWAAGPHLPGTFGATDNPGAMLPNGKILIALSPIGGAASTSVYEFDPNNMVTPYTDVTPSIPGFALNLNAFTTNMLVLPTGQVLFANNTGKVAVYTPDLAPNNAWLPTITNITGSGTNLFTVTGTQLNGISEGACFGDDNEMSTNYPIVQIRDAAGNISYARSLNWSSTGVQTGSSAVTTQFVLTSGTVSGGHLVSVIANGIASAQALEVQGTTGNDLIVIGPNGANTQVNVNGSIQNFPNTTFMQILVNGGDGNDIIRIENNAGKPTMIDGGTGDEFFDFTIGSGDLDNIIGPVSVRGSAGNDGIFVYDNNNATSATYTITDARFDRPGWGGFFYESDVESESLTTGILADTVNVLSTFVNQPVSLNSASGADSVNVGNASNGLQSIKSNVSIDNGASMTHLNISDAGDNTPRTGNVGVVFGGLGVVLGMTGGGSVLWNTSHVSTVNITTGSGADTLNVESNSNVTTLNSTGGLDTVNVGNSGSGVQLITGPLSVFNSPAFTTLTVDDSADTTARNPTLDTVLINGALHGRISGLAPAAIDYRIADTSSVNPITINAGSGADGFTVLSTPASRTLALNLGPGADTINVQNTGATSTVNLNMGNETDTANVFETATDAQVRIIPSSGDDSVYVNPDGAGFAAVRFDTTQRLGVLGVAPGGIARLTANANEVLTVASLVLIGSGSVDLANNDMIIDYGRTDPISDITAWLTSGYAGGGWNGNGIRSSLGNASTFSLGYAEAFEAAPGGTFSGQPVDASAILIKYTYYGDSNLDGQVNVTDLGALATNWQSTGGWFKGDFSYDNAVNVTDLGNLATNWQLGVGNPLSPSVKQRRAASLDVIDS